MQHSCSALSGRVAFILGVLTIVFVPIQASAQVNQFDFFVSDIVYQSEITANGANVGYAVSATRNAITVTASCTPLSGSLFPIGDTTISCSATDNLVTGTASFVITVSGTDSTPPNITPPPNVTVYQEQGQTDPLTFADLGVPTVNDDTDPAPLVTNNYPNSEFPLGDTVVTWTATDHSGNSNIATQTVTVNVFVDADVIATPPHLHT